MPSCDVTLCPRPPSRVRPILRETGHFKLNFPVENSNFSQFFYQAFIFTHFPIIFAENISFHRHFKLIHFSEKSGRLSSTGSEILAFGSHYSANIQPILDCFIPKFKLKYDDL